MKNWIQYHPYHLVSPSPWPIFTSCSLFSLTLTGVLFMHGFYNGGLLLLFSFLNLILSMSLWFKDITSEGT